MNDPPNNLESICYPPEPLEIPYSPNKFLCWDFFDISNSKIRVRPRFFDQVGHQTTNASNENKFFFTK